jgi:signal transduction histidine kinase
VRHAPGAATEVEFAAAEGRITVTVVNGPPLAKLASHKSARSAGAAVTDPHGSGLGLVGMRERVSLDGGTLETGPTADGGFRVYAVLPSEGLSTAEESQ